MIGEGRFVFFFYPLEGDGAGGAIVVKDTVQISICKTSCERPWAHR